MRISPIAMTLVLAGSLQAAAPVSPTAAVAETKTAAVAAPVSPVAAVAVSPTPSTGSGQAASPSAEAAIIDDSMVAPPTPLDFAKAETKLLASIAGGLKVDEDNVLYNIEENAIAEKAGPNVNVVAAAPLFAELAKRAIAEDKEARQALTLAILRKDSRAKEAKDLAYEERLANSLIKRIDNGDKGAKDELAKLAAKGNSRARVYLGLDAPAQPPVEAASAVSGTAAAVTSTAAAITTTAAPAASTVTAAPAAPSTGSGQAVSSTPKK